MGITIELKNISIVTKPTKKKKGLLTSVGILLSPPVYVYFYAEKTSCVDGDKNVGAKNKRLE